MKSFCYETTKAVLVGNKCDLTDERVVSFNDGQQLAEDLHLPFFEASAKENINVRTVFDYLVDVILEDDPPSREALEQRDSVDFDEREDEKIQSCRC